MNPRAGEAGRLAREADPVTLASAAKTRNVDAALLRRLRKRLDRTWLDVRIDSTDPRLAPMLAEPIRATLEALDRAYRLIGIKRPDKGPALLPTKPAKPTITPEMLAKVASILAKKKAEADRARKKAPPA